MSRTSHRIYGRTLARSQALQLLFQAEVTDRAVDDVLAGEYALSNGPLDEFGESLARGVGSHIIELDRVLAHSARNWALSRMSGVDRNLLRIALYEMLYLDEIDTAVCISECVELAKAFGSSDESSRFVNGILGRIAAQVAEGVDVVEDARRLDAEEAAAFEKAYAADYAQLYGEPEAGEGDAEAFVDVEGESADVEAAGEAEPAFADAAEAGAFDWGSVPAVASSDEAE